MTEEAWNPNMDEAPYQPVCFELDPGEEVSCYYCMNGREYRLYRRGEAFLCGADHSPYDGNANYICKEHLEPDAVIHDPQPLPAPPQRKE